MLRSNGANVTLSVDADVDIYVNNTKKGTRSWTGSLKAGSYQVECRQANHRPSSQNITVTEGKDEVVTLTPPTPITGVLAISSSPINASIKIDGKDYGTTPRNITDLLIGQHTVTLSLSGYNDEQTTVEVKEQQTTDLSLTLKEGSNKIATATAGASLPKENKTFTVNGVSFEMVLVEGGTFQMGNNFGLSDESPEHAVTLDSYYIGQTEVTQALWYAVMGNNPSKFKGGKFPVESVKWKECLEFISRLNQVTGKTFRLPTEAEWEYAARGGNKSKGYQYSGSNNIDAVAWYGGNSGSKTHEVATKQPNELGIYDMSGNVWEWCQDRYKSKYYSSSPSNNPPGSSSGSFRVIRGGSWGGQLAEEGNGDCSRVSRRAVDYPFARQMNLGFRLALSE
ncbi:MAG: SUMF1/EgtB/PvdO family nonheme iron enzyme [Prevotella sp.]|nr:SUMF1/EgtB/PvdO family nonheme iron enzyme [Prevotella sp.]